MDNNHITLATDPDGRVVVGVRLTNAPTKTAWVYGEDFEQISALYPGSWSLVDARKSKSYVRVRKDDRSVYIARLVAGAFNRTAISYADGDSLNLRKSNLCLGSGNGGPRKHRVSPFAAFRIPTNTTPARA